MTNLFASMTGWQCVEIKGPDAQDFLQRLTTVDFKRLPEKSFTPGTLLNPTGKVQLYFKALHLARGHYLLLVPPSSPEASSAQVAYETFERMYFRENLTLAPLPTQWI